MQLLPVPVEHAEKLRVFWEPLLPGIALAGAQTVEEMSRDILSGEKIALLAWDNDTSKAHALAGVEILRDGRNRLVCHLVWCTGQDMTEWRFLLAEIERWAKEHIGCAVIRATHRTGWSKYLRLKDYRETHRISEKELI